MVFNDAYVQASDGTRLFCRIAGEGPTTLLFLHGWGGSGSGAFWDRALQHLDPSGLRLVLVDLRGHGRSDHATEDFTTERFAEDMFNVADQVGARELVLVAFSMSARWAQWMACTKPDRVVGQILFGPAPAAALPLTEAMLDDWITATASPGTFVTFIGQFTKNPLDTETLDGYYAAVHSTPERSLRESFRMCTQPGFSERLVATRGRTLVVAGAHDPLLPSTFLREEVVRKLPAARLVTLDCGHEIPLEQPQATAALIEAFVAGLANRPS